MHSLDIENKGNFTFKVKLKDCEFVIDTKEKSISPLDALLASLGSCVGVYIRKYFEGAKLELKDFDIKVESEFLKDRPPRFRDIFISIDLKETKINELRKKSLLEFIKNCPVGSTLKNSPNIEIAFK